jgi:hypothetical protein
MWSILQGRRIAITLGCILGYPAVVRAQAPPFEITTYHYDNLRSGWNEPETTLRPINAILPAAADSWMWGADR